MKAITTNQPWATLLVLGASRYSIRTWRTVHRGPLAIFAGNQFTEDSIDLCLHEEVRPLLSRAGYDYVMELPVQAIVGTADLLDCVQIGTAAAGVFDPADPACRFDVFYPENWVWIFQNARALNHPVFFRGKPGIFTIPDWVLEEDGRETGRQGGREAGRQGDRETGRQGDKEIRKLGD